MMIVVRGDVKQLAPKAFGKQLFKKASTIDSNKCDTEINTTTTSQITN